MRKSLLLGGVGAAVTISALAINYAVTRHDAAVEPVASVPLRPASSTPPAAPAEQPAVAAPSQTAAAEPPAAAAPSDATDAGPSDAGPSDAGQADAAADAPGPGKGYPEFDIVRINPAGDAVIAGRAAPGSEVTLLRDGQPIDSVTADDRGEWVLLPGVGVLQGAREITLASKLPGQAELRSPQVVMLVKPDGTKADTDGPLALLMASGQKGGGTVLQTPDPTAAVPAQPEPESAAAAPASTLPAAPDAAAETATTAPAPTDVAPPLVPAPPDGVRCPGEHRTDTDSCARGPVASAARDRIADGRIRRCRGAGRRRHRSRRRAGGGPRGRRGTRGAGARHGRLRRGFVAIPAATPPAPSVDVRCADRRRRVRLRPVRLCSVPRSWLP